jgi:alpha-glucosidase (family GH31 glycosyl hydrolase)
LHYNVHNLYGWGEGRATKIALEKIRGKRAMIISRSTFATSGTYNGHWLGDNQATWEDLYYSIAGVLSFNMLGIPLVGADTCGFAGNGK